MSVQALKEYMRAKEALAAGDRRGAALHLKAALGSQPDNPVIENNLAEFLDHESDVGDIALGILRVEAHKRENPNDDRRDR